MELNEDGHGIYVLAIIAVVAVFVGVIWLGQDQTPPEDTPECGPSEVLDLEDPTNPICVEPSNQ